MKEYIKTIIAIISLIIADLTNNVIGKFIKVANSTYNIKPFWFSVIGSSAVIAIFIELSVKVNSKSKIALIVEFIIAIINFGYTVFQYIHHGTMLLGIVATCVIIIDSIYCLILNLKKRNA